MADKKPEKPTAKPEVKEEKSSKLPAVYVEYVQGKRIDDIAEDHDLSAQEVLDVINEVEAARKK